MVSEIILPYPKKEAIVNLTEKLRIIKRIPVVSWKIWSLSIGP